jgi:hypothetical protein
MTNQPMVRRCASIAAAIGCALMALMLSACAQTAQAPAANEESEVLMLNRSAQLDFQRAAQPETGPVARQDLYTQAADADTVIHELENGYQVPPQVVTKAAWVPAATMSPAERANLIAQLEQAKVLDGHGINDHNDNPILTEDFIQQNRRATRAIETLRSGEDLTSQEITEALYVPERP